MPRISRKSLEVGFYHVMEQGINREFIFNTNENKNKILKLIKNKCKKHNILLVAYCIMDNHFHALVKCNDIKDLTKTFSSINTSYAIYYNKIKNRVGYVFRDRYRAEPIFDDLYLYNCIKYIHENPLKANIVTDLKNYEFSSYNDYCNDKISEEVIKVVFRKDIDYKQKISGEYQDFKFIDIDNEFGIAGNEKFEEVIKEFINLNFHDSIILKEVSNQLKKRCGVTHKKIYEFMKISKTTYFEKLKECDCED